MHVLLLFLVAYALQAVDVMADQQLKLTDLWWLQKEPQGRRLVWLGSIANGDLTADMGAISKDSLRWRHRDYPITEYVAKSKTEFTITCEIGTLEMKGYRARLWQGHLILANGTERYFRTRADDWPSEVGIDFTPKE